MKEHATYHEHDGANMKVLGIRLLHEGNVVALFMDDDWKQKYTQAMVSLVKGADYNATQILVSKYHHDEWVTVDNPIRFASERV